MKNVLILVWALFTAPFSFANTPTNLDPETGCRKISFDLYNKELTLADRFRLDLENGTWLQEVTDIKKATYQFHDYGLVDVLTVTADKQVDFKSLSWKVEILDNLPFLVLSDGASTQRVLFQLEQTCKGMNLKNVFNSTSTELVFQPVYNSKVLNKIKFALSGKWTSITYPFDLTDDLQKCGTFESMKGAYLEYEFRPDGTFEKRMGADHLQMEEQGYWELSADGQYLIMHGVSYENPEKIYATTVAELSHVNPGELVLTQALHVSGDFDTLFCTEIKSFYFNKN